jgi:hypothetical protein
MVHGASDVVRLGNTLEDCEQPWPERLGTE